MDTIETENSLGITFCERLEIAFTHGEGSHVWDETGKRYLDFTSGWGVTCLGHGHPVVTGALTAQAARLIQGPNAGFTYSPSRAALLALLKTVLPANLAKIYFCNSGAEANDAALKLARKITGRAQVISTRGGFHGRTFNTLAVTRGPENAARYVPVQDNTRFVPFGDSAALASAISDRTAAVIVEPVQGEGGVQIPPADYLSGVQALCKKSGALFIVDEIQTGFCRTGKLFALEHSPVPVAPDFLTMGKGIAGGFPFAGFAVSAGVAAQLEKDDHGGTYCGNPLGCAISHAVVSHLVAHDVADAVARKGEILLAGLAALRDRHPGIVKSVRGRGLLCALEFHDAALTRPVTLACVGAGLLVVPTRGGIIRLLPDLLVKEEHIIDALAALESVLVEYS